MTTPCEPPSLPLRRRAIQPAPHDWRVPSMAWSG